MDILTFQDIILQVVQLALNKEQNAQVPPFVISTAVRLSTDYILDEIVRVYPYNSKIVDKARPFIKRKLINIDGGIGELPTDYRNILAINIAVNKNMDSGCNCDEVEDCTPKNDKCTEIDTQKIRKEKCYFQKIDIVDSDQFADASMSELTPPSYKHPIGMFVGMDKIKICPINEITYAEVIYIKSPKKYEIGYKIMPDDTWQIDTTNTNHVEIEWEHNIAPEMFKAVSSLLGLHTRDGNFVQWNNELKKIGMF